MEFTKEQLENILNNLMQHSDPVVRAAVAEQGYGLEGKELSSEQSQEFPNLAGTNMYFEDFERIPPRKMAVDELAFKELELYADGYKCTEISKLSGRTFNFEQAEKTFFRIVNFGYEGIIPPNITPKYSPEVLCKKTNARADFYEGTFTCHSLITKQEFLSENFLCGCRNSNEPLSLDSDIRRLDLSVKTFNPLMRGFNQTKGPYFTRPAEVPFTIRNLVEMTEQNLLKIRRLGKDGVAEIKEELAKHGFEISKKPSFESILQAAETKAANQSLTPNAPGKEPEPEY